MRSVYLTRFVVNPVTPYSKKRNPVILDTTRSTYLIEILRNLDRLVRDERARWSGGTAGIDACYQGNMPITEVTKVTEVTGVTKVTEVTA